MNKLPDYYNGKWDVFVDKSKGATIFCQNSGIVICVVGYDINGNADLILANYISQLHNHS